VRGLESLAEEAAGRNDEVRTVDAADTWILHHVTEPPVDEMEVYSLQSFAP
jgi:hypothetical protein